MLYADERRGKERSFGIKTKVVLLTELKNPDFFFSEFGFRMVCIYGN